MDVMNSVPSGSNASVVNLGVKVSIVINNFNYERYVGECISSALGQTYRNIEVIVVDDGSTDDSRSEISKFGNRIASVNKANAGQGSAYNAGFAAATGDWVLFLDSDDFLRPTAIEACSSLFQDGVSKVQFRLEVVDRHGRSTGLFIPSQQMAEGNLSALVRTYAYYNSPPSSGNIYPRWFLGMMMPLPDAAWRISADAYLILGAPLFGSIATVHSALGSYRRHGSGKSDLETLTLVRYIRSELDKEERRRAHVHKLMGVGAPPLMSSPHHAKLILCAMALGRGSERWNALRLLPGTLWGTARSWPDYSVVRRCVFIGWCVAVALLPRPLVERLILRTFSPHVRGPLQRVWQTS